MNVEQYLCGLSDEELLGQTRQAAKALESAAETQTNSEWHAACFAATVLMARECNRRGLKEEQ